MPGLAFHRFFTAGEYRRGGQAGDRRRPSAAGLRLVLILATLNIACGDSATDPPGDTQADQIIENLLDQASHGLGVSYFRLPSSHRLGEIPQDPNNPLTAEKVVLGQLLFHETALASDNVMEAGFETYSCASCHFAQAGFMANLPQGIGEGGSGFGVNGEGRSHMAEYDSSPYEPDAQPIRTPSVLNTAYQELMLWNGQFGSTGANVGTEDLWEPGTPLESNLLGFHGLETQAHAGLGVHRLSRIEESMVYTSERYAQMFAAAYPDHAQPINVLNAALSIAAFERTVLASESPWQLWLRGNRGAMTADQKSGAILFFGKARCVDCHTGPALSSMTFFALGMDDLDESYDMSRVNLAPTDGSVPIQVRRGRGGFTGNPADDFKFKTPQLYNLSSSPFLGHGASFSSVRAVLEYKNAAQPQNSHVPQSQLADGFTPLGLSVHELDQLTAFVEEALFDAGLMRYVPPSLPSGYCTPVNDAEARADLDC